VIEVGLPSSHAAACLNVARAELNLLVKRIQKIWLSSEKFTIVTMLKKYLKWSWSVPFNLVVKQSSSNPHNWVKILNVGSHMAIT